MRIGHGYDVHRFAENRSLIIGGAQIPYEKGLLGHSDADVLLHAICDALLGAAALGDIGRHFPDTSEEFKGIDSRILLRNTVELLKEKNYQRVTSSIVIQNPEILFDKKKNKYRAYCSTKDILTINSCTSILLYTYENR